MASASLSWWRLPLIIIGLSACGLDLVGAPASESPDGSVVAPDGGPVLVDGSVADASVDAGPTSCDESACAALGSTWKPVAVAFGNTACPSGSSSADSLKTGLAIGAGACDCKITSTLPNCTAGNVTFEVGGSCASDGVSTTVSSSNCHGIGGQLDPHVKFAQLPASGGSCTAQVTSDGSKVTTSPAMLCGAPSACRGKICGKVAPAGFRACIVADKDVACDVPGFTDKHLVGSGIDFSCTGNCGNCVASNPTCGQVSIDLFSDPNCGTKIFTLPANTCTPSGSAANKGVQSMIYNATPIATYTPTSMPTASATLSGPRTVCCAP